MSIEIAAVTVFHAQMGLVNNTEYIDKWHRGRRRVEGGFEMVANFGTSLTSMGRMTRVAPEEGQCVCTSMTYQGEAFIADNTKRIRSLRKRLTALMRIVL